LGSDISSSCRFGCAGQCSDRSAIADALAKRNILVWSGHNYALEVVQALDLLESGGTVPIGAVHYKTPEEVDRVLNALEDLLG